MDKIRDGKIFSRAMGFLFSFGGGFLFSGTNLGGIDSFADISLTGAVGFPYGAAVFSGAVVRCVLTDSVGKCVVKLCAMALIIAVKMFSEIFNRPVAPPCDRVRKFPQTFPRPHWHGTVGLPHTLQDEKFCGTFA